MSIDSEKYLDNKQNLLKRTQKNLNYEKYIIYSYIFYLQYTFFSN